MQLRRRSVSCGKVIVTIFHCYYGFLIFHFKKAVLYGVSLMLSCFSVREGTLQKKAISITVSSTFIVDDFAFSEQFWLVLHYRVLLPLFNCSINFKWAKIFCEREILISVCPH